MDGVTVSKLTETLLNILLGCFGFFSICLAANMIQTIIIDHRREKREAKKEAQDDEYHAKRMQDLVK